MFSRIWSALRTLLSSRFQKSFGSSEQSPTTTSRWLTSVGKFFWYREKLSYGIDGNLLSWLRNFLVGRTHCTRDGNCMSETCDLRSGVIQGSTIGPLLFISFINELADLLGPMFVTSKLFADDLKVYAEVLTTIDRDCFQLALDRIAAWCSDWQ